MMTLRLLHNYLIGWGARWAWSLWNRGEGERDKSPLCLLCRGRFAKDTTDLLPTCYGLVADLLATSRGSYGETGVMDFALK